MVNDKIGAAFEHAVLKKAFLVDFPVAVGFGVWSAETDPDGTHQCRESPHRQSPPALPLFRWRGQAGQVLGPGVQ